MKEIQDTVYMWNYSNDLPKDFEKDFNNLFSEEPNIY